MRSKTQSTWHEIVYLKEHQLLKVRLIKAREKHSDEAVLHSVGLNQSTLLTLCRRYTDNNTNILYYRSQVNAVKLVSCQTDKSHL